MRYLASFVVTLAWGLWFGGMVALVLFVQTLFAGNRSVAVEAAPMLFVAFGRVQLLLGACALIGTFAWWVLTRRRGVMTLFVLFAISAALAAASLMLVVAPMERLREQGRRESPEFKRLHGASTSLYMGEMVLLLVAGAILPGAMRPVSLPRDDVPAPRETTPDTATA
jgi:hypothetical protein